MQGQEDIGAATGGEGAPRGLHRLAYDPLAKGPLAGVRVLDMSRLFAGNLLSQQLADFGAEVVKVEPPSGDTLRHWTCEGIATHWKVYARSKKSLAMDLRRPQAAELLLRLMPSASIFIESFRPGVLESMGMGPAVLLEHNPKLIIIRISGWGQDGRYRRKPGFGTLIEGMSGFAAMNGFEDREPVLPPMYLADGVAGLFGVSAALTALREVECNGGHGQVVDLPLFDPLFAMLGPQAANFRVNGQVRQRTGSRSTNSAPRNVYRCSDGRYVGLSGSTQTMAERVLRAIGRGDLVSDPRFSDNASRVRHAEELDEIIGAFIARHTQDEAVAHFDRAEVTVGPIYDISQILADEHFVEREVIADYPDAEMGYVPMHHVVPRFSGTPGSVRSPAPSLGEHNRSLLAEIGIDEQRYGELLRGGEVCESVPSAIRAGA